MLHRRTTYRWKFEQRMNKFSSYFPFFPSCLDKKTSRDLFHLKPLFPFVSFFFSYCHKKKILSYAEVRWMRRSKEKRENPFFLNELSLLAHSAYEMMWEHAEYRKSKRYTSWLVELSGLVLYCFMRMTWCFENCKDFEFIINIFWHQNMLFWWREN